MIKKRDIVIAAIFFLIGIGVMYVYNKNKVIDFKKNTYNESATKTQKLQLEKNKKYNGLRALGINAQISYFSKILGNYAILNYSEDRKVKTYIFIDDQYYVQATTNSEDKVISYAITTRTEDFNPTLSLGIYKLTLGKTTLAEIVKETPFECRGFMGNTAASYYYESIQADSLSHYLALGYGYNDAGYNNKNMSSLAVLSDFKLLEEKNTDKYDCNTISTDFRKKFTINTFIVMSNNPDNDFEYGVSRHGLIN